MSDDYEVGYGKPPKHSQFKPKQSGNGSGHKKSGAETLGNVFAKEINRRRAIEIDGKRVVVSPKEMAAKQLWRKAAKGDSRAFEIALKAENRLMLAACRKATSNRRLDPERHEFIVSILQTGPELGSHCDTCGIATFDENERDWREGIEQGFYMPPIRYNGPDIDEEKERVRQFCEELIARFPQPEHSWPEADETQTSKEPKKKRALSLCEHIVEEGNKRIRMNVSGKAVMLTLREIAAQQQSIKAMKGDLKAIALCEKYGNELGSSPALAVNDTDTSFSVETIEVTLDFEEKPSKHRCDPCRDEFRKSIEALRASSVGPRISGPC